MADGFTKDDEGFAAVDALTALVILSTTIVLSIGALSSARKIQRAAAEASAARTVLQLVVTEVPRPPGGYSGVSGGFDWTLQVSEETAPSAPVRLCVQKVTVQSRHGRRSYDLESRRPCPSDLRQP